MEPLFGPVEVVPVELAIQSCADERRVRRQGQRYGVAQGEFEFRVGGRLGGLSTGSDAHQPAEYDHHEEEPSRRTRRLGAARCHVPIDALIECHD